MSAGVRARLRVGVDVGGTFTKAVAVDLHSREIAASAIVPTTHAAAGGVAEGVVAAVVAVAEQVGADRIELVTHSTTQAVNALLEGDTGAVGVIGIGRRPDLKKVARLTGLGDVEVATGKRLRVIHHCIDVTDGLPVTDVERIVTSLRDAGVVAVAVAEAFSPDDSTNETAVAEIAAAHGLPVCASTELSGLYGLELRTVTAALNASILPIAVATADVVAAGVRAAGIEAPVMVMRSDGGATDLAGFRSAPVRTLYSGPAASVAGALRYTGVTDAIVIEVGGTSTNIAAVRNGRPALSYVRVASHATALRSVDVRVVGVAGGSMLRVRRRRVHGVGPRSAHIAGLRYASFVDATELDGATVDIGPALPGDPPDYLTLRLRTGERIAVTTTCAANALGIAADDDYCRGDRRSAALAFEIAASALVLDATTIAQHLLQAAGEAVCELALAVAKSAKLESPSIIGVGGGAGGLARHAAAMLGWPLEIPQHAEVISSIGDALSLIRAERERTVAPGDPVAEATARTALLDEVEAEVVAAGASPASLEVRLEEVPERSIVRAIATGAVGLAAGALPGRDERDEAAIRDEHPDADAVTGCGAYWIVTRGDRIAVLDRYGDVVDEITGEAVSADRLGAAIDDHTRHRGPVTLKPSVWVVDDRRLLELASIDPEHHPYRERSDVLLIVGRSR